MAVLETIRVKLGVLITVLIAVALLSFIIDPSTLEMTFRSLSSKYDVGKIDGESISYEEFQKNVDYYTNIYTMTSGSQSLTQEAQDAVNQTAWNELQNKIYILPLMKSSGINVGEEELLDLSQGTEISPVIAQEPAFKDATGAYNREQFLQFIQSIPTDQSGRLASYWDFLENNVINAQYFTKYQSLLTHNILNPIDLRRSIEDNNITSDCEFLVVPAGFAKDSTITVAKEEIKKYYNNHKENYKVKASRDIDFVAYEVIPSEKDFQLAKAKMDKLYEEFTTTNNLKTFLARNSDSPLSNYYFKEGELQSIYPEIDKFAFEKNATVLPIFKKGEQFIAARVIDTKKIADSAFVQHILLPANESLKADSLLKVVSVKGADFSKVAAEYSQDKNPNVEKPGDIGWMTQSYMIPGMERVLTMATDKPAIMNTQYGIHIVKVTKKTAPINKVQIAMFVKNVVASKDTYQIYYSQANDLASKANGNIEEFNKAIDENNLPVVPANGVAEGARKISKYENVKEVSRWIYEAKKGEVSPILTVDNKYFFVVALKEITKEGYAPVEKVENEIKFKLTSEKKVAKLLKEVETKVNGLSTMEEMAEALNVKVNKKEDVSFGAFTNRMFEPALVGVISGSEVDKVSKPFAGEIGVYIVKVLNRETGAFYTEQDAKMRNAQMQQYQLNTLPAIFGEMAKVKDNRARFY